MRYQHFKGGVYEHICEATLESDPSVKMIVYRESDGSIWTRPASEMFEEIERDGIRRPRFVVLPESEDA